MTQYIKNKLVKVLDAEVRRDHYGYSVLLHHRHKNSDASDNLAWSIRLIPLFGDIQDIGVIVKIVNDIDHLVRISLEQDNGGCILLF